VTVSSPLFVDDAHKGYEFISVGSRGKASGTFELDYGVDALAIAIDGDLHSSNLRLISLPFLLSSEESDAQETTLKTKDININNWSHLELSGLGQVAWHDSSLVDDEV
jgi:hypothetical protein